MVATCRRACAETHGTRRAAGRACAAEMNVSSRGDMQSDVTRAVWPWK